MKPYQDYKQAIDIQIRFSDIDKIGHVNNACYLNYFELGRVCYFNNILVETNNWDAQGFVLARTELDHLLPIYLTDKVSCYTKVIKIGNKSLIQKSTLLRETKNGFEACANAMFTLVAMDYTSNQSMRVPDKWREIIETFER
jgi:acyl-CoA thioester hydrolase